MADVSPTGRYRPPRIIEKVTVRILPDGRMTRADAAKYLGVTPKTLAMWKLEGHGPESLLVGSRRFYYQETLDKFIGGDAAA